MTTKEQIQSDFMVAFKAKDFDKKTFLGTLKGEIQTAESKDNWNGEVSVMEIVTKMNKSLKISGDADSLRELTYLESYLPKQMSEDVLQVTINSYINTHNITTPKEMGKVMGYLKSNYGGQYDGKLASTIIKELLV